MPVFSSCPRAPVAAFRSRELHLNGIVQHRHGHRRARHLALDRPRRRLARKSRRSRGSSSGSIGQRTRFRSWPTRRPSRCRCHSRTRWRSHYCPSRSSRRVRPRRPPTPHRERCLRHASPAASPLPTPRPEIGNVARRIVLPATMSTMMMKSRPVPASGFPSDPARPFTRAVTNALRFTVG